MARGLLPFGAYLLTVENIGEPRVAISGRKARRIDLRWKGTDLLLYWFCSDVPASAWAYNDVVDWEHLDDLIGRTFLFIVAQDTYQGVTRNRVKPPALAEVIE